MGKNIEQMSQGEPEPPPGMHVSNRKTERICREGKIIVQTWVRYCCPLTDWILVSETKTNESC